jgi:hypothetical protein
MLRMDNLRLDGALKWKAEDRQFGRTRIVKWKVGTSKVVALSVLVNDRCVGPMNNYWTYWLYASVIGPSSLVVSRQQKVNFGPTASMIALREKPGGFLSGF